MTSFTLVLTSEIDSVISEAVPHPTPTPASKAAETYLVPAHYGLLLSNPVFPTGFPLWGSLNMYSIAHLLSFTDFNLILLLKSYKKYF